MDNEVINKTVREDLSKKIGVVFLVLLTLISPMMWMGNNDRTTSVIPVKNGKNSITYKNGFITKITDEKRKVLWLEK